MIYKYLIKMILLISGCFIVTCTQGDQVAGGSGSTTTNGFTAQIFNKDGNTVSNALVRIRPIDYCATGNQWTAPEVAGTVMDTFTENDGTITVANMASGIYSIEVFDKKSEQGIVIRSEINTGKLREMGQLTIESLGTISGALDAELVDNKCRYGIQIYGMELIIPVDSATGTYVVTELPPAQYSLRVVCTDTSFKPINLDPVTVLSGKNVAIDPLSTWLHQGVLNINNAMAGLSPTDVVCNFPLLLRLDHTNFDFTSAKKKGQDFRVTKNDGSVVHFETEWWDSANSTAAIWILIDTLYGNKSLQTLQLYWGNSNGSSVSKPIAVFDTAFGFRDVWHLNESGGTVQKDATVNSRNGTPIRMDGANDIPGIIGRSQQFEGDSQCIVFNISEGVNTAENSDTSYTVSAWVKPSGNASGIQSIFSLDNARYGLFLNDNSKWTFYDSSSDNFANSCLTAAAFDTWSLISCVRRGTWCYLYVNGSPVDSFSAGISLPVGGEINTAFRMGCFPDNTGWLAGILDEFRICRPAVSDLWIRLCYQTQREGQTVVKIENIR